METNPWKTLSSKQVYKNPWISVREDQVITPNGKPGIYGVVESKVATGVVALDDDNNIILVGQYRYPTKVYSWELPEGGAEPSESPLVAIKRELKEEAGISAKNWEPLGDEIHLSNCFTAERAFLFLARNLTQTESSPDETEQLQVKKIPIKEALQMVLNGKIYDALTIIGILRVSRILGI